MIGPGVGSTGSPIARLITSTPAALALLILFRSSMKRYGGIFSSRVALRNITPPGANELLQNWVRFFKSPLTKRKHLTHARNNSLTAKTRNREERIGIRCRTAVFALSRFRGRFRFVFSNRLLRVNFLHVTTLRPHDACSGAVRRYEVCPYGHTTSPVSSASAASSGPNGIRHFRTIYCDRLGSFFQIALRRLRCSVAILRLLMRECRCLPWQNSFHSEFRI